MKLTKKKYEKALGDLETTLLNLHNKLDIYRRKHNQRHVQFHEQIKTLRDKIRETSFDKEYLFRCQRANNPGKIVQKIDTQTKKVIASYPSITDAARFLTAEKHKKHPAECITFHMVSTITSISRRCNLKTKTTVFSGYSWKFKDSSVIGKHHSDMPDFKKRKLEALLSNSERIKRKDRKGYM